MAQTRWRRWLNKLSKFGYRRQARERLRLPTRRRPMRGVYPHAVLHDTYSVKARFVQRTARISCQPLLRWIPLNDKTIRTMRKIDQVSAGSQRSRFVEPVKYELGGVSVESMTHRYGPTTNMTILYLHGGGFISCGIETHRRICERLAHLTGANVISVDYIQLPEGVVADSVEDAIDVYQALLEGCTDPSKIVVAGDSAGGYLSMKVAELADRRGMQAPAGILGFSPLLSLDPERDDKGVQRIDTVHDAYLPPKRMPQVRQYWKPEGSTIEGCDAPLDAVDFIHSPVFMTATEDEMLRPEVEAMALRLADRGTQVEVHIWRKQVHAFPVMADAMPESRHALELAAEFARVAVGDLALESTEEGGREGDAAVADGPGIFSGEPDDRSADEAIRDGGIAEDKKRGWFTRAS